MLRNLFIIMIVIVSIKLTSSTRRIVNGKLVYNEKRFMVYFLKSEKSNRQLYDSWLCGGAIISQIHILTSAACLGDVTFLYVIAGYNKYVRSENLDLDECTRERKQKVVKTCVPRRYKLRYHNVSDWAFMDIGIAIVEKPYNFSDVTYRRYCSYPPAPIRVNFDPKYEEIDTDMFVYGWGHNFALRLPGDYTDYNQEYLHETSTRIVDKKYCMDHFFNLTDTITRFAICCTGQGTIDFESNVDGPIPYNYNGCGRRRGKNRKMCGDLLDYEYDFDSRRNENKTSSDKIDTKQNEFRKQGVICQNDHGGPLVTWVGYELRVTGVAVTSLYNKKAQCVQPHIYTSTLCASVFIQCVMDYEYRVSNRRMCDNMGEEVGYDILETEVDWNKPDENPDDNFTFNSVSGVGDNRNVHPGYPFEKNQNNANNVGKDIRTNKRNQEMEDWPFKKPSRN